MAGAKQERATVILLKATAALGSGWGRTQAKPIRDGLQFADSYTGKHDEHIDWNGFDPAALVGQSVTVTITAMNYKVENL